MSGTSTLLGIALAGADRDRARALGTVVGLVGGGAAVGAVLARVAGRRWAMPAVLGRRAG